MRSIDYGNLMSHFKELDDMQDEQYGNKYSTKSAVESNLNIHIYNASGRKKKLFVSFFGPQDYTNLFPEEYKGWVLEKTNIQRSANQNYLNSAHYIRDFTDKEHEEFEKFMEEQPDAPEEQETSEGQV